VDRRHDEPERPVSLAGQLEEGFQAVAVRIAIGQRVVEEQGLPGREQAGFPGEGGQLLAQFLRLLLRRGEDQRRRGEVLAARLRREEEGSEPPASPPSTVSALWASKAWAAACSGLRR